MLKPIAKWNSRRDCWEKSPRQDAPSGHSVVYSATWPTSGMTRNGEAFEHRMPEPRTSAIASSSSPVDDDQLLRTPIAAETDGGAISPAMAKHLGSALRLSGQVVDLFHPDQLPQPENFLPTPRTSDVNGPWPGRPGGGQDLRTTVSLLPTPTAALADGGSTSRSGDRSGELLLGGIVQDPEVWGKFAPAIARWEMVLGRPAPAPTEATGRGGRYRLSPAFVEWMMGLPEGWVTDIDISRAAKLRALGNGVLPHQATAALEDMLSVFEYADAGHEPDPVVLELFYGDEAA